MPSAIETHQPSLELLVRSWLNDMQHVAAECHHDVEVATNVWSRRALQHVSKELSSAARLRYWQLYYDEGASDV